MNKGKINGEMLDEVRNTDIMNRDITLIKRKEENILRTQRQNKGSVHPPGKEVTSSDFI